MRHSSTLSIGVGVHKESIAVAYVAHAHDAEVIYLGTIGTRQADIDQLVRKLHSKAKHLVFVYEAGPCGQTCSETSSVFIIRAYRAAVWPSRPYYLSTSGDIGRPSCFR
jgi:hypothetical protein